MRYAVATLALLATGLLAAAPAFAGHKDFRVGVTDRAELAPADIAGMGRANVRTFRVNFSWVHVESGTPHPGASCNTRTATMPGVQYRWERYDALVRRASARGVRLLPVIVGSPAYVARQSTHAPYSGNRREVEAYQCFVRALVGRYGRGGDLPGVKAIKEWQAWNEPNLIKFSTEERGVNPREYANLVRLTSNHVRAVDPRAVIALAGLPTTNNGFNPTQFLSSFYQARGIEREFDVIALHPYARDHRGVKGAVLRARELLRDVRDRGRYIWITEFGWATRGSTFPFAVKSRRGQASELRKTYRMLRNNRREWNIGTATWFRWRDQAVPSQNRGAFDYMGLYTEGGNPKPACERFVRFTNGSCGPIRGLSAAFAGASSSLGGSRALAPAPRE